MAGAAAPNGSTPPCNGWSACCTTAAVFSFGDDIKASWPWPAVQPAPEQACCRPCASRPPPGLLHSCGKGSAQRVGAQRPHRQPSLSLELDLPSWTLAADIDLRTWLYGFGEGIRVEGPTALRKELVSRCWAMLAAHGEVGQRDTARGGAGAAKEDRPASLQRQEEDPPPRAPFPNRLRRR